MIRKAEPKDYDKIIELYKSAFQEHNIFTQENEKIKVYLENTEGTIIVAEEEGTIAGACLVTIEQPSPEHRLGRIKHLAVGEDFRKRGIGKMLLEAAEGIIGEGKVEVHIANTEGNACPFYSKYGYKKEGELKEHYRKKESMVIMGKILEE